MKHLYYLLCLVGSLACTNAYGQAIYTYTSATNGAPSAVAPNTTYTNLTAIGTGTNTQCTQGFSGITGFTGGSYNPSGPCVSVTVRPNNCYKLSVTGFHAGLRRSGTGPAFARLAYSIDGGATWIDAGTNASPSNTSCATSSAGVTNATWNINVTVTSTTLGIIYRIYPFGASASTGTLQIWGLNIYGTVVACAPTLSTSITNVSCNGGGNGAVTLNVTGGCNPFTYSWTGPNNFTSSSQNISGLTAGTYSVSVSSPGGCVSSTTAVVTQPAPITTSASNNGPICSGGNLILSSSTINGATYSWTGPNSYSSNSQNAIVSSVTTAGTGVYTITATLSGCIASDTTHVLIDPSPTIAAGTVADPTTCSGTDGSITLTGLQPSTSFVLTYTQNSSPQTLGVVSDVNGDVHINNLAAGTYDNIVITLGPCASNILGPVVLADPPIPATPVPSYNGPLCTGDALLLSTPAVSGASYSWSGPGSFTSSVQDPVINSVSMSDMGSYSVTVTVNGCVSPAGSVNVVIYQKPDITGSQFTDPTTCNGSNGTITLTGLAPATSFTVQYELNSVTQQLLTLSSDNSGTLLSGGLAAGSYGNLIVSANGCSDTLAGPIVLTDPATPVLTAANNGPMCEGDSLNLTATSTIGNVVFSWSGPNGFVSSLQNPVIDPVSSANGGTYIVSASINNCTSVPVSTNVVIGTMPNAPVASNNGPICSGNDLYLYASTIPGVTYNWTGPGGFISNLEDPIIVTAGLNAAGSYEVTAQLGGCISVPAVTQVIVNPGTVAPVANDVTYCQYDIPVALSATGQNLLWYTNQSGGVGSVTAPAPSTASSGSTTYYVSQSQNNCESQRIAVVVVVNEKPVVPQSDTLITYCQGQQTSALSASGQGILWYNTPIGGAGSANAPVPQSSQNGSTFYFVSQTVNGCESDRLMIRVIVGTTPPAPGASDIVYCTGTPAAPLTAAGTDLAWYDTDTGSVRLPAAPVPNTTTEAVYTWYVTQSLGSCESARSAITVSVYEQPSIQLSAARNVICQYDTISFTTTGTTDPRFEYTWKLPYNAEFLGKDSTGNGVVAFNAPGNGIVSLVVNNHGCLDADSIAISVSPAPEAAISLPAEACTGEVVRVALGSTSLGIKQYNWTFNGATIVEDPGEEGPHLVSWNAPGVYTVTLVVEDNICSSPKDIDSIVVYPLPDASISYAANATLCIGDSLKLSANVIDGSVAYKWAPKLFFMDGDFGPEIYAVVRTAGVISLSATSVHGCTAVDSVYISAKPCCPVYFPTAFSPNKDGSNDLFRPIADGNPDVATFVIVNRWGLRVFESASDREGWDGSFKGEPADVGVYHYYYKYRCDGKVMELKGEVTLVR